MAAPLVEVSDWAGGVEIRALLRKNDRSLARRYLDATKQYLALHREMLPDYPYPSFALVENSRETGYGMLCFTLLGSRIIRFPWILTSSHPHELLHNWWGNSVYVDPDQGNWCEGLTTYMADHLFAEQRGRGVLYRRVALRKYTDFAAGDRDFPLAEFRSRYSALVFRGSGPKNVAKVEWEAPDSPLTVRFTVQGLSKPILPLRAPLLRDVPEF
uniref:Peptidase MA superfamily n=1 Tax=Candidatus Kentrum sp. LFY TaxID=2126342 RepID=A0A450V849_9GAMM|nr:MAG: Peptidase MA superfamily [Candidatus Kentron sp. LFY]